MDILTVFKHELSSELEAVLHYWKENSIDDQYGGFIGQIDHYNNPVEKSPKGIILNTRILWSFSRANNFYGDHRYDDECARAFEYLHKHFRDDTNEGVYWEVDVLGNPLNKRKQIYAQAFCIYALSEYYKYSKNTQAYTWAISLYQSIEYHALDNSFDGYFEAFDEFWKPIDDVRLSAKDINAPKTTNTHLHILEAYTTLYEITLDENIEKSIRRLINIFFDKIFSREHHQKLFFTNSWNCISTEISFGHDIEAVWLLLFAAKTIDDQELITKSSKQLIKVVDIFIKKAIDNDFGILNSKDSKTGKVDFDKHWWPQIEAMVGLTYAWKITNEQSYLNLSIQVWEFIKSKIIDKNKGEWFFRVNKKGMPYTKEDKVGPWKCPYHNSRGLIEVISMLEN